MRLRPLSFREAILRFLFCFLLASTLFGQKREDFIALVRDVSILSDRLDELQKTQNAKLDELAKLLQMAIDNQGSIRGAITNLEAGLAAQQKSLAAPVTTMSSKVDGMAVELGSVQATVAEINAALRRMQAQMTDLDNAIKTLNAPPPPPGDPAVGGAPPAGMTAEALYQNALRSKSAGQLDLAAQQFNDYLRYFGNTDLAPNAQYYLGEIAAQQGRNGEAIMAFDQTIERYPETQKTLDAMYMKGVVLLRTGQKNEAAAEFRALIKKAPNSEQAAKAQDQIRRLAGTATSRKK
jgi:TolA-binding protein